MAKRVYVYKDNRRVNRTTRELIKELKKGNKLIVHRDPSISMVNGGSTEYKYLKIKNLVRSYSSGQNWRDQGYTYFTLERVYEQLVEIRKSGYTDNYREETTWIEIKD